MKLQLENKKVQMLFTNPVTFKIHGLTLSSEDGNLFLEILNEPPVFTSNAALFERLCEVVDRVDEDDLEMALGLISDPEEKDWFKDYLIHHYLGNDTGHF